jgi:tetratricopeptide (TPR) repeat protein
MKICLPLTLIVLGVVAIVLCSIHRLSPSRSVNSTVAGFESNAVSNSPSAITAIISAPCEGTEKIDQEIRSFQREFNLHPKSIDSVKRLGWAFVKKARLSYDPGYYKLAEKCALFIEERQPDDADALLLQGHILQSLHRFNEAEQLARKLVTVRDQPVDEGLLGDVLMEQGNLTEAVFAYQKMVDSRPDLQAYTRVAHLRWLKGNLDGAIEVMAEAVTAANPRDPEPGAWAYTRLGLYELQNGQKEKATISAGNALEYVHDFPPALLLRGRVLLDQGDSEAAMQSLRRATELNPLPEYQWILADVLRAAGEPGPAAEVEEKILNRGEAADPRTFALYLATRGEKVSESLKLARAELETRKDVFTLDAVAWALRANGRFAEALDYSSKSQSEGTRDARLFYHAGSIALDNGLEMKARDLFIRANEIKQMLFPSEQADLAKEFAAVDKLTTSRQVALQLTPTK